MSELLDRLIEDGSLKRDNVKTDSRQVDKGDVFIAIEGTVNDGHDYVDEALKKGASYAFCQRDVADLSEEAREKVLVVNDTRETLGEIAKRLFKDPSETLEIYGVTGTNGKTTTVFLIDSILNAAGKPSGFVSTVFSKTKGGTIIRSGMTTPDSMSLNRLLSEMVSGGKRAAVVEISSHALSQKRTWGIKLDSAVFTNITPEHLDYHGDMETYLADKAKIFGNLKPNGSAVLNLDDTMVVGIVDAIEFQRLVTFGMNEGADVRADNINLSSEGTEFDLVIRNSGSVYIKTGFIGRHNVYNMLAASAALVHNGVSLDEMKSGLERAEAVPGRLERIGSEAPFQVFVDYAHTSNALENVLECLRSLTNNRLICVFGCGGDRDKTKRPVMGQIATDVCDDVILTSDNPRTEDPVDILGQIENGVRNKSNYSIIEQRKDAIKEALEAAKDGDIVVIAGKGHEDYQIIGEKVLHFDDREVARETLKDLGY